MPNQAGSTHSERQEAFALAEKWMRPTLCILSAGFILLFLYTSLRRIGYPFSFDQIEGGIVTSVWRIAHGHALYTSPTRDFVPYLYAPLYLYLAAALSKIVGAGYISLRKATVKIVLTVSTPKNGSYIVTGAGAGIRLAVNDALREYERTAREKNRPTLNRLAKQQVFTTLQLRLEALEAADEA